jgi:hypothetical protein
MQGWAHCKRVPNWPRKRCITKLNK